MNKDNFIYLEHIFERATKIMQFIDGMNEADFLIDEKTQSAVIRELEVISEAAKRISDDFKHQHTDVPWKQMAGIRDVLIHSYDGVDLVTLWDTIQNDIPVLLKQMEKILNKQ